MWNEQVNNNDFWDSIVPVVEKQPFEKEMETSLQDWNIDRKELVKLQELYDKDKSEIQAESRENRTLLMKKVYESMLGEGYKIEKLEQFNLLIENLKKLGYELDQTSLDTMTRIINLREKAQEKYNWGKESWLFSDVNVVAKVEGDTMTFMSEDLIRWGWGENDTTDFNLWEFKELRELLNKPTGDLSKGNIDRTIPNDKQNETITNNIKEVKLAEEIATELTIDAQELRFNHVEGNYELFLDSKWETVADKDSTKAEIISEIQDYQSKSLAAKVEWVKYEISDEIFTYNGKEIGKKGEFKSVEEINAKIAGLTTTTETTETIDSDTQIKKIFNELWEEYKAQGVTKFWQDGTDSFAMINGKEVKFSSSMNFTIIKSDFKVKMTELSTAKKLDVTSSGDARVQNIEPLNTSVSSVAGVNIDAVDGTTIPNLVQFPPYKVETQNNVFNIDTTLFPEGFDVFKIDPLTLNTAMLNSMKPDNIDTNNTVSEKPEKMSQEVFDMIQAHDKLRIEDGKVWYLTPSGKDRYFTITKNPSISSHVWNKETDYAGTPEAAMSLYDFLAAMDKKYPKEVVANVVSLDNVIDNNDNTWSTILSDTMDAVTNFASEKPKKLDEIDGLEIILKKVVNSALQEGESDTTTYYVEINGTAWVKGSVSDIKVVVKNPSDSKEVEQAIADVKAKYEAAKADDRNWLQKFFGFWKKK